MLSKEEEITLINAIKENTGNLKFKAEELKYLLDALCQAKIQEEMLENLAERVLSNRGLYYRSTKTIKDLLKDIKLEAIKNLKQKRIANSEL